MAELELTIPSIITCLYRGPWRKNVDGVWKLEKQEKALLWGLWEDSSVISLHCFNSLVGLNHSKFKKHIVTNIKFIV